MTEKFDYKKAIEELEAIAAAVEAIPDYSD